MSTEVTPPPDFYKPHARVYQLAVDRLIAMRMADAYGAVKIKTGA